MLRKGYEAHQKMSGSGADPLQKMLMEREGRLSIQAEGARRNLRLNGHRITNQKLSDG